MSRFCRKVRRAAGYAEPEWSDGAVVPKRREDLYAILWAIETPRPLEGRVVVNRQRPETRHAALLRSADVARILPYSIRQIEKMAAEGTLPGFKLPGCVLWLFDETVVRKKISIYISDIAHEPVPTCRNR